MQQLNSTFLKGLKIYPSHILPQSLKCSDTTGLHDVGKKKHKKSKSGRKRSRSRSKHNNHSSKIDSVTNIIPDACSNDIITSNVSVEGDVRPQTISSLKRMDWMTSDPVILSPGNIIGPSELSPEEKTFEMEIASGIRDSETGLKKMCTDLNTYKHDKELFKNYQIRTGLIPNPSEKNRMIQSQSEFWNLFQTTPTNPQPPATLPIQAPPQVKHTHASSTMDTVMKRMRSEVDDSIDKVFAHNVLRMGSSYGSGKNQDNYDDNDNDGDMKMYQAKSGKFERQQVQQWIKDDNRYKNVTGRCELCCDSSRYAFDRIVFSGSHIHLAIASKGRLSKYHCIIFPVKHVSSFLQADEEVWEEAKRCISCLSHMFRSFLNQSTIYTEVAIKFHSFPHARIDVVPISDAAAIDAQLVFRQCLSLVGNDWDSASERLIQLNNNKSYRGAIPDHFQYFHVEWGEEGFLHVINETDRMDDDDDNTDGIKSSNVSWRFGRDTIESLIHTDENEQDSEDDSPSNKSDVELVTEFKSVWEQFNWVS